MKRFHIHVSVNDLPQSIRFYSTSCGVEPSRVDGDYAKWMLEEPQGMHAQLQTADARPIEESEQACCYAESNKYWVTDPTGIAWETSHTLGNIPVYREDTPMNNA